MSAFAKAVQQMSSGTYVLAVSGGRDSMSLLHAFARWRRSELAAVATFDHGSGPAATDAADFVVRECLSHGIPVVSGRAPETSPRRRTEAVWRAARWAFLRAVAEEHRATIVTAHTLDDQAETVAMRILRDASARGLAAMAWPTPGVARPLLHVPRAALVAYAEREGVPFIEDPTNADARFLRNRVRAGLLAAAEARHPGFAREMAAIGERAAAWRGELAALVSTLGARVVGHALVVDASALDGFSAEALRIVWPEIAGRLGVVLDRRGVDRLAGWSPTAAVGGRIPLSGGAHVERTSATFVLRGGPASA